MLPITNEDDGGSIFLLTGSTSAIDSLVNRAQAGAWDETSRQVRLDLSELYSATEKEVQESNRLHVVDLPADGSEELWGRLLAEISYISSLNAVMYDYKQINEMIVEDTGRFIIRRRNGSSSPSSVSSSDSTVYFGDLELHNAPYIESIIPSEDYCSISKYLCEWPVLVLCSSETPKDRRSYVLPLHPVHDVIALLKGFRSELDKFLKEAHVENPFDFSLFSGFHAMQLLTTRGIDQSMADKRENTAWIPYYLSSGIDGNLNPDELVEELATAVLTNPFCCYQLLRYVCLSVKCGFSELIGREHTEAISYYEALQNMEKHLKDISICQQMGHRLAYNSTKYAALLTYGLIQDTCYRISHADLVRLTQYERLECDVGSCFPSDPEKFLPIQRLSEFVKRVLEETPILVPDVPHTELGNAFERLRQMAIGSSTDDSIWLRFNTDVFFMNSIAHQTMKGDISRKGLSCAWAVPANIDPAVQWIALFAAGFAFTVELPANLVSGCGEALFQLDFLDNGHLACGDVRELFENAKEMDTFLIHIDYKDLPWQDCMERLKELYRLKNSWTRLELCAWLDRCLTRDSEQIEEIIQRCLISGGNSLHENVSLHLEKRL